MLLLLRLNDSTGKTKTPKTDEYGQKKRGWSNCASSPLFLFRFFDVGTDQVLDVSLLFFLLFNVFPQIGFGRWEFNREPFDIRLVLSVCFLLCFACHVNRPFTIQWSVVLWSDNQPHHGERPCRVHSRCIADTDPFAHP